MQSQGPLAAAGPAQHEWLIHFCGRPCGRKITPYVPDSISTLTPQQRLNNILWEQRILGFPSFGADRNQPMVCLSESPPKHMDWLLHSHQWPPWGVLFQRQWVYNKGGGPVWYARTKQHAGLTYEQRPWVVRFNTTGANRSDWVHEREWRIPVPLDNPALHLAPRNDVAAILVADRSWRPTPRIISKQTLIDRYTGAITHQGNPHAVTKVRQVLELLPPLWENTPRGYWDSTTHEFIFPVDDAGQR